MNFFHIKKKQKFNATKNSCDGLMDWNGYRTTLYYQKYYRTFFTKVKY